ncbi:MAG TPA: hypothetical protein VG295_02875 [Solirubrobacteraceae bacterium]|jgi:hypothetical protein|nr:hypothetical protein [Solirubrobacteraceae bacterium]
MRRLNLPIAVLAALIIPLSGLVAAAPAAAYNVSTIYKDCENNGQLTGHYSRAELQAALNQLPAEVSEYSACADVIRQALVRASSHSSGHGGSSGTPGAGSGGGGGRNGGGGSGHTGSGANAGKGGSTDKRGRSAGTGAAANAITLAGSGIRPGSTGSGGSSLPVALIVVLVLLALTAVSGGAVAIRRRVVARHST